VAKRKKRQVDPNEVLLLLELRMASIQHCTALRSVILLLEQGKTEAAIARLEGAVASLHATVRSQCAGQKMACPNCGSEQDVVAWVDDGKCDICGEALEFPE
jgi:hypothetical protein